MKKILVAFDGTSLSRSTAAFAISLTKESDSMLVGVFLHDVSYAHVVHSFSWEFPHQYYSDDFWEIEAEDERKIRQNIKAFTKQCEDSGIRFKTHLDKGVPLVELLKETAFADVVLIDARTSFYRYGKEKVNPFIKDLLVESKCPVLIVPSKTSDVKRVFVTYDGGESSTFAMKMFSYIFPEWTELNTTIVTVNYSSSNHVPKNRDVKDLAAVRFKDTKFEVVNGNDESALIDCLKKRRDDAVVVMGSYGRSALSRMFHASLSNKVISEVKVPVFIAHL